jgi:hypothetical protein
MNSMDLFACLASFVVRNGFSTRSKASIYTMNLNKSIFIFYFEINFLKNFSFCS